MRIGQEAPQPEKPPQPSKGTRASSLARGLVTTTLSFQLLVMERLVYGMWGLRKRYFKSPTQSSSFVSFPIQLRSFKPAAEDFVDQFSLSLLGSSRNSDRTGAFLTASADSTLRLWDVRDSDSSRPHQVFRGHTSDVWSVEVFQNGSNFVSSSEDGSCRIWDVRWPHSLMTLPDPLGSVGSAAVGAVPSVSGRLVFVSYREGEIESRLRAIDVLTGDLASTLSGHNNHISALAMSADGSALWFVSSFPPFFHLLPQHCLLGQHPSDLGLTRRDRLKLG